MNRRRLLAKLGGVGILAGIVGGVVHRRRSRGTPVVSEDEGTAVEPTEGSGPGSAVATRGGDVELVLEEAVDRLNSGAVTFVHDAFSIHNRDAGPVSVWIDADPVADGHGTPSVRFYRGRDLRDRIDSPPNAADLEPDSRLAVGVLARTVDVPEGPLLDRIVVRSERQR